MLKYAGPPNKECPYNAKLSECQIGFGDDMFCKPCMKKQREFRNNANREQKSGSQALSGAAAQMTTDCDNSNSRRKSTTTNTDSEGIETLTGIIYQWDNWICYCAACSVLAYMVFALQSGIASSIKML